MLDYQYFKVSLIICHFCFHLKFSVFGVIFWNTCKIFLHYFIGFLTSINYMDKWVTPLGRVFKIHDFFLHGFDKKLIT